ncbi:Diamine acetyltransferase 1 [Datura stramonium]|uniref:Diamine acetyltransferase 1 n=1 Tax=Datura stramonium TaxID=4076 RepID=A0ABS8WIX9_DATST|nr:Diamine acetyltransferase 1 [Datura stramonium]
MVLKEERFLALVIQNRVSEVFAVDIHPGAKIGSGILLDHATGVVIGETAVIGNNVSIFAQYGAKIGAGSVVLMEGACKNNCCGKSS